MKNFKYIILLFLTVITVSSCTDMLMEENKTEVSREFLYSNPEALERAVIALYAIDRSYFKKDEQVSPYAYMLDIGTDIDWFRAGGGSTFANYDALNPRNSNVKEFWTQQYQIIGKSNEILAAARTMERDSLVERIIGETSLFRAHAYYWLMIKFGKIFLTTEPTTYENLDKTVYTPAATQDVWKLINSDLDTAITILDWEIPISNNTPESGRFNKAVAKQIKAKAAMWNQDWKEAIKQCEDIFTTGKYQLLTNPKDVFEGANLNHKEAIYTYQFKNDIGGGGSVTNDGKFVGHRLGIITVAQYRLIMGYEDLALGGYGWGRLMPNNYLFSLYTDKVKDKRFQQFFRHYFTYELTDKLPVGKALGDTIFPANASQYWENFHPQCTKFVDKWTALTPSQTNSFKDVILYRLAETYLLAAEAYMNDGNQTKAKEYYNKTWMRAGNAEETRDISLQMIMDEHARELCMEGHRFAFLKRIGKLAEQVRNYGGEYTTNAAGAGRNKGVNVPTSYYKNYAAPAAAANRRFYFKDGYENWPIPQSEIDQMGAQNFPQHDVYK